MQEPKKWTEEEAKEWWLPAAADALQRAGKPLAEGDCSLSTPTPWYCTLTVVPGAHGR